MEIVRLFFDCDEFCQQFLPQLAARQLNDGKLHRQRESNLSNCRGISFVDATSIAICHNRRINSNKVFGGVAKRGKTSVGWFHGFKVHLVINDCGELLGVVITPGNVDDRKPVSQLSRKLFGKLFGDRGYISQELFKLLMSKASN